MVDEGVAVFLMLVDTVVAFDFFLAHRVLTVPFEQKIKRPGVETGVRAVAEHIAAPSGNLIVVAGDHVEIRTRDVAFVFIHRLEHFARISGESADAELAQSVYAAVGGQCGAVGALPVREVAALTVHFAVGGIDVERIALHGIGLAEPALRHRVLTVDAIANFAVITAMLFALSPAFSGIDIPDFAVFVDIGVIIDFPKTVVSDVGVR